MSDYTKLAVWKKAHTLTLDVYTSTQAFPKTEMFGLTSQMRRSAASVGCNIAEGLGRRGDGDLARFLKIAMGSINELEYQLLLARDLKYLENDIYKRLQQDASETGRMLTELLNRVEQRIRTRVFPGT